MNIGFESVFEHPQNDAVIIYGKKVTTKRKVAWYGDKAFEYRYSNVAKIALPWSPVLKLLKRLGCGLDIVSGGELYRGLKAGISPDRIVYSGVGKRLDEVWTPRKSPSTSTARER